MVGCGPGCLNLSRQRDPNRSSGIPRLDQSQHRLAPPQLNTAPRRRSPCPYRGSQIPTRVPPYSGRPLYLPPIETGGSPPWPGMRSNLTQELRDFQYDQEFFDEDRPMMRSQVLVTGKSAGGMMRLRRSNQPDMAVNQPIQEYPRGHLDLLGLVEGTRFPDSHRCNPEQQ
ncbi:hypothetical protein JTB14_013968 [Gonioctena quinquepunctata]|nr:hypothetical protein JTB14_013968 [Gonioctena quinquepunctata]